MNKLFAFAGIALVSTLLPACAPTQQAAPTVKRATAGTRIVLVSNSVDFAYAPSRMALRLADLYKSAGYEVTTVKGAGFDMTEYNDTGRDRDNAAELARKNDAAFVISTVILLPKYQKAGLADILTGDTVKATGVVTVISRQGASLSRSVIEKSQPQPKSGGAAAFISASDAVVEESFVKAVSVINP
jgi:hypothetical protein